jgi:hypothetical protein
MYYEWLADLTVGLHVAYVACVFFGLVVILLGRALGWRWVTNRWFRGVHLFLIVAVVIRTMLTPVCPLTVWEEDFAARARTEGIERSAVGLFLHNLIHPNWPIWVFPILYVAFALLIVSAFWLVPVRWRTVRPSP